MKKILFLLSCNLLFTACQNSSFDALNLSSSKPSSQNKPQPYLQLTSANNSALNLKIVGAEATTGNSTTNTDPTVASSGIVEDPTTTTSIPATTTAINPVPTATSIPASPTAADMPVASYDLLVIFIESDYVDSKSNYQLDATTKVSHVKSHGHQKIYRKNKNLSKSFSNDLPGTKSLIMNENGQRFVCSDSLSDFIPLTDLSTSFSMDLENKLNPHSIKRVAIVPHEDYACLHYLEKHPELLTSTSTNITPVPVSSTSNSLALNCNPIDNNASCTITQTGITQISWILNGQDYSACEGQSTCLIALPSQYNFSIQVIGQDASLNQVDSNIINLAGNSTSSASQTPTGSLTIKCPSTSILTNTPITCTELDSNLKSKDWYLDGSQITQCNNLASCTFTITTAGSHSLTAIGFDSNGIQVNSNVAVPLVAAIASSTTPPTTVTTVTSFSKDIMPVITQNCLGCHNSNGINIGSYNAISNKVVANNSSGSTLYNYMNSNHKGAVPSGFANTVKSWIDAGAVNN